MIRRFSYYGYRLVSGLAHWFRRRFTNAGLFVIAALVFSAIAGMDTTRTVPYQIFTFLFALLLVAIACSFFSRPSFTAQRILPRFGSAGEILAYHLAIQNRFSEDRRLGSFENLIDLRLMLQEFVGDKHRLGKAALVRWDFDRRWQRLVTQNSRIARQPSRFFNPRNQRGADGDHPMKRGHLKFKASRWRADPFGLFRWHRTPNNPCHPSQAVDRRH